MLGELRPQRVLFATCFSEPLEVPPWTDAGLSWGTLDPILQIVAKIPRASLLQISKTPGQQIAPTIPSQKTLPIISSSKTFGTCVV